VEEAAEGAVRHEVPEGKARLGREGVEGEVLAFLRRQAWVASFVGGLVRFHSSVDGGGAEDTIARERPGGAGELVSEPTGVGRLLRGGRGGPAADVAGGAGILGGEQKEGLAGERLRRAEDAGGRRGG
jgi:hypothetical protein